jgi:DNA-directed RNA polymerase subunit M/transcription elongation factor TFIIS
MNNLVKEIDNINPNKMSDSTLDKIKNITIENFNYKKEYVRNFDFITGYAENITYELLKYAEKNIDRKSARNEINKYVKYDFISYDIERSIFEFALISVTNNASTIEYVEYVYNDKLHEICINLDKDNKNINNKTLLDSILEKNIKPTFIAFLTKEQLHPIRWKDITDKVMLRDKTLNNIKTTDRYTCKRCGEKKFKVSSMQTRCADEPCTYFCVCVVCGFTFTKSG